MSDARFPAAAVIVIDGIEKPLANDPRDPGKLTKWGLSSVYHPEVLRDDFTRDDAMRILEAEYWDAHRCGEMPWQWALAIFDASVNPSDHCNPIKLAQLALQVVEDGAIGPASLRAMAGQYAGDTLDAFYALRVENYMKAENFAVFGHGWIRRCFTVQRKGLQLSPMQ